MGSKLFTSRSLRYTLAWLCPQAAIFTTGGKEAAPLVDALSSIVGRININSQVAFPNSASTSHPLRGLTGPPANWESMYISIGSYLLETCCNLQPNPAVLARAGRVSFLWAPLVRHGHHVGHGGSACLLHRDAHRLPG